MPMPWLRWFLSLSLIFILIPCLTLLGGAQSHPREEPSVTDFNSVAESAAAEREAGKTEEALRDYKHAVEFRPDWEEGWWYLGTLRYDTDRFEAAIPAFQKVVQHNSGMGPAWNFLGLCEFETKDYRNSLAHLQKGQDLGIGDDPEIARVSKYHLGLLLNRTGEFERAASILAPLFSDQPSPQIKIALGLSLLRIPLLPQEVDPSRDALLAAAGETAGILAQGDKDKTLNSFLILVKNYPGTPYTHYAYGTVLAAVGRNEDALIQQREELKISPASALPLIEISLLELRLQHLREALHAAEAAVQLAPESPSVYRILMQSHHALGNAAQATEDLRQTKALEPEKPQRETRMVQLYASRLATTPPVAGQVAMNSTDSQATKFEGLSRQAAASEAAGNNVEAMASYQEALQLRPEWNEGRWNLAMLEYEAKQYPDAISALKLWVERKPNYGTAWAVMGLAEFEMKDYNNALIHLQRGRELGLGGSPVAIELARYRLAVLLNWKGQHESARELLAVASTSESLAKEVQFALGMALLRIALMPEQVELSKNNLLQAAGEIAVLLQDSKYDVALPKLQTLLQQYPATPFLHYVYGTALASLSQYDDAEEQFRQELLISPKSGLPYMRLASIELRKKNAAEALFPAQQAVRFAPDTVEAHYLLGRSYLELGQESASILELETARTMAPGSPEIHFNLAKAYAKAKLPEKEQQERAAFARLNALAEQERSERGDQSYAGPRDTTNFSGSRADAAAPEHQ
jgi:predicted Zn-dependent protease